METSIRVFAEADIEFAMEQTLREGWDSRRSMFEACLSHDPEGCFVAENEGHPVGMVTTTAYERTGWIGNLIVVPETRRQGVGEQLMRHGMDHLASRGIRTIRLDADPMGVSIYLRLGFVDEYESLRFVLEPGRQVGVVVTNRITEADVGPVFAFDRECFGDNRERLLRFLLGCAASSYLVKGGGRVRGYALAVATTDGIRIGPWEAEDCSTARMIMESAVADHRKEKIVVGMPGANVGGPDMLEAFGFVRKRPCRRMVFGERAGHGCVSRVFGMSNGAMG